MSKAKMGHIITVNNADRRFGSNPSYKAIWTQDENGAERCLLFTESDIIRAKARADANMEDVPKRSFLNDLLD